MTEKSPPSADRDFRPPSASSHQSEVSQLVASAGRWMTEALDAWSDADYAKVAVHAPLAVEHLGKAVLWDANPVLLVPLSPEYEASLMLLATQPDLRAPKLRTVSLAVLLRRLDRLVKLPLDDKRRSRLVEIRNGAVHIGSMIDSKYVIMDALAVCDTLLQRLNLDRTIFYGSRRSSVLELLDDKRSETQNRVTAKRAQARRWLEQLEGRLGDDQFAEVTAQLEARAADTLDSVRISANLWAIEALCPECASKGRLFGRLHPSVKVEYGQSVGNSDDDTAAYFDGWNIEFTPLQFECNVCKLSVEGGDELAASSLPSVRHELDPSELGPDFDEVEFANLYYRLDD